MLLMEDSVILNITSGIFRNLKKEGRVRVAKFS